MVTSIMVAVILCIGFFLFAGLADRKIRAIKAGKSKGSVNKLDGQRFITLLLGGITVLYGTACFVSIMFIGSIKKSCAESLFVPPEKYGEPIDGLWFYEGNSRMKSDGSERQLLADKIELRGETYNLTFDGSRSNDRKIIKDDSMYFTQTVSISHNQYVYALFSYSLETENLKQIYAEQCDSGSVYLIDVIGSSIMISRYESGRGDVFYVSDLEGNIKSFTGFKHSAGKYLYSEYGNCADVINWTEPDAESKHFEFGGANEMSFYGDSDGLLVIVRFSGLTVKFYYYDGSDLREIFRFGATLDFSVQEFADGYLCEAQYLDGSTKIYYYRNGEIKEVFKTEQNYKMKKVNTYSCIIPEKYYVVYTEYSRGGNVCAENCSLLRIEGGVAEIIYTFKNKSLDYTDANYIEGYINFSPRLLKKNLNGYYYKEEKEVCINLDKMSLSYGYHSRGDIAVLYEDDEFMFWLEYKRTGYLIKNITVLMRKNKITGETEIMQYRNGRSNNNAYPIDYIRKTICE